VRRHQGLPCAEQSHFQPALQRTQLSPPAKLMAPWGHWGNILKKVQKTLGGRNSERSLSGGAEREEEEVLPTEAGTCPKGLQPVEGPHQRIGKK